MRLPQLPTLPRIPFVKLATIGGKDFGFGDPRDSMGAQAIGWLLSVAKTAFFGNSENASPNSLTLHTGSKALTVLFVLNQISAVEGHHPNRSIGVYHPPCGYRGNTNFYYFDDSAADAYVQDLQRDGANITDPTFLNDPTVIPVCNFSLSNGLLAVLELVVNNFSYYQHEPFHQENLAAAADACRIQQQALASPDSDLWKQGVAIGAVAGSVGVAVAIAKNHNWFKSLPGRALAMVTVVGFTNFGGLWGGRVFDSQNPLTFSAAIFSFLMVPALTASGLSLLKEKQPQLFSRLFEIRGYTEITDRLADDNNHTVAQQSA